MLRDFGPKKKEVEIQKMRFHNVQQKNKKKDTHLVWRLVVQQCSRRQQPIELQKPIHRKALRNSTLTVDSNIL